MARPNYGTIQGGAKEQQTSVLAQALGLHGEYQAKPQEEFDETLEGTQEDALAANQAILGDLSKFAALINDKNTTELLKMMERMVPGYMANLSAGIRNASALMAGRLPADAQRAIADYSASRGITSGTSGSPFADTGELWRYGISTLEGQQRGLNQFLDISARSPKAPLYDFTSMFITPMQIFQTELQRYQVNLPVKLYNEWAENQPKNWERAAGSLLDWVATEGTSVLNMYTGSMMGGMGGGAEASTSFGMPQGVSQGAGVGTGEGGPMSFNEAAPSYGTTPSYEAPTSQFEGLGDTDYGSGENWQQFYQSPYFG